MEIVPFESIGSLRFGESRQSIRHRIGSKHRPFKKNVGEPDTDAYDEIGLHLYFDRQEKLELVEAFGSASPSIEGIAFLGRQIDEVASDLLAIGHDSVYDDAGLQCESAGIGLIAPEGIVEGVAAFRKGYYED